MKTILPLVVACAMSFLSFGQWDTLSPIPESFTFPVVTALGDHIHIMGGGASGGASNLHYAYDTNTDTWEQRASIPFASQQPAGAAADGKIHFFGGGVPNSGSPIDDHAMYDPTTDSWTEVAKLTQPRAIHDALGLDGVLHSLGGQGISTRHEIYNAASDEWESKASLPDGQFWYGAHIAADGKIYRFCGGGYTSPVDNASVYYPDVNIWSALPDFPVATHGLKGAAIGKKIYLTGGYNNFLQRDELYVFDMETKEYTLSEASLPKGRNYHNVVAINGCLYVLGGFHDIDETLRTQLIKYCPPTSSSSNDITIENLDGISFREGTLRLDLESSLGKDAVLSVYDVAGRHLFDDVLLSHEVNYETQLDLLAGQVYFARLQSDDRVFVSKFLAQ